ncbi:unnamed protein product [Symbiodinium natans]|uniref:Uncharacterized protein n=1 Tax=Symbiodinium natans TaxID=878477 RepID=A0A812QZ78_9DINO|nr:unnamed protein product [Symbiodinium natans]
MKVRGPDALAINSARLHWIGFDTSACNGFAAWKSEESSAKRFFVFETPAGRTFARHRATTSGPKARRRAAAAWSVCWQTRSKSIPTATCYTVQVCSNEQAESIADYLFPACATSKRTRASTADDFFIALSLTCATSWSARASAADDFFLALFLTSATSRRTRASSADDFSFADVTCSEFSASDPTSPMRLGFIKSQGLDEEDFLSLCDKIEDSGLSTNLIEIFYVEGPTRAGRRAVGTSVGGGWMERRGEAPCDEPPLPSFNEGTVRSESFDSLESFHSMRVRRNFALPGHVAGHEDEPEVLWLPSFNHRTMDSGSFESFHSTNVRRTYAVPGGPAPVFWDDHDEDDRETATSCWKIRGILPYKQKATSAPTAGWTSKARRMKNWLCSAISSRKAQDA